MQVIDLKAQDKDPIFALAYGASGTGKTHFVASAICLISKEKTLKDIDITYVTFKKLTDEDILNYITISKPLDKAGSYGIQDDGFDFATSIEGSKENVIGFPIVLFEKLLDELI